jgi:hypothetical protein
MVSLKNHLPSLVAAGLTGHLAHLEMFWTGFVATGLHPARRESGVRNAGEVVF